MSDSSPPPLRSLKPLLFLTGLLLGFAIVASPLALLPKKYLASTTIQIPSLSESKLESSHGPTPAELQAIRSRSTLEPVVKELKLSQKWHTDPARNLDRLTKATSVHEVSNTELVRIAVIDPDPQLAADAANAIAESYQKNRLREQRAHIDQTIEAMKTEIESLQQNARSIMKNRQPGQDITELQQALQDLQTHTNELAIYRLRNSMPRAPVTVWEYASPPTKPSFPRPLIVLPAALLFGLVLGTLFTALSRR